MNIVSRDRVSAFFQLINRKDHVFDCFEFRFSGRDCVDFFSRFDRIEAEADERSRQREKRRRYR